jgi:hypothetical protein
VAAACHRIADMYRSPGGVYDLARAVRTYHRAIAAYEQCGLFDEARLLTYRVAALRLWHGVELGVPWGSRVGLFLFWAVAGFGLRPLRVLVAGAAVRARVRGPVLVHRRGGATRAGPRARPTS